MRALYHKSGWDAIYLSRKYGLILQAVYNSTGARARAEVGA